VVYHALEVVIGSEMTAARKIFMLETVYDMGNRCWYVLETTRGGGVVEKRYINNINIERYWWSEAILFDMYYMAKDPVSLAGEKKGIT